MKNADLHSLERWVSGSKFSSNLNNINKVLGNF